MFGVRSSGTPPVSRSTHYDAIVVGGGAAGCVVAGRLAEDPSRRVLLVEAGPRARGPLHSVPGGSPFAATRRATNWNMMTTPQAALNGRQLYLSQARVLGGGTAINGMVYTRGSAADYDDWADLGAEGWGYHEVLPFFLKSECSDRGISAVHSIGGPLSVVKAESSLPIARIFLDAAEELGLPRADDLNTPEAEGIGPYDWMVADGRRASTATAFLGEVRPNLVVLTGSQVTRIRLSRGRAVGIDYVRDGHAASAESDGEIVLSGGALQSPSLLMRSGIGPADHLAALGICVWVPLAQVGRNLRNHLSYKIAIGCDAPVSAYRYFEGFNGPPELLRYLAGRKGFLANGSSPAGGFFRSSAAAERPDMQLFMLPALTGGLGSGLRALLPSAHGLTLFINQGRPLSHGQVRLASADPRATPLIEPNYLAAAQDLDLMLTAIERIRGIVDTPALRAIGARALLPKAGVATRREITEDLRARAGNHFHVVGTCRIGRSSEDSVVDTQLRVHGVEGLRVADASVMPAHINANTAAAAIMIAERCAAFIAGTPAGAAPRTQA